MHTITKSVTNVDQMITDADSAVKRAELLEKQTEYVVLKIGITADQLNKQSIKESKALDLVTQQIQLTLGHVDSFVTTSTANESTLLATTQQTAQNIQPILIESKAVAVELHSTLQSVNKLVSDPALPIVLKNVQDTTKATSVAMKNVDDTSADVKQVVHNYLHPTWPHKIFSWTLLVVHALNPL